jgi:hypothetical protein
MSGITMLAMEIEARASQPRPRRMLTTGPGDDMVDGQLFIKSHNEVSVDDRLEGCVRAHLSQACIVDTKRKMAWADTKER